MFILKPVREPGEVVELDGDKSVDAVDLTALASAELLQGQDFGEYGNPDARMADMGRIPGVMQTPMAKTRTGNVSGRGNIQKTARTTAPMSNPFPAPSSAVRTSPSTIQK
jgi:hypothetical protein